MSKANRLPTQEQETKGESHSGRRGFCLERAGGMDGRVPPGRDGKAAPRGRRQMGGRPIDREAMAYGLVGGDE